MRQRGRDGLDRAGPPGDPREELLHGGAHVVRALQARTRSRQPGVVRVNSTILKPPAMAASIARGANSRSLVRSTAVALCSLKNSLVAAKASALRACSGAAAGPAPASPPRPPPIAPRAPAASRAEGEPLRNPPPR